jgi:hypothetical protein
VPTNGRPSEAPLVFCFSFYRKVLVFGFWFLVFGFGGLVPGVDPVERNVAPKLSVIRIRCGADQREALVPLILLDHSPYCLAGIQ